MGYCKHCFLRGFFRIPDSPRAPKTSGLDQLQDAVKELARQSADAKADRANLRAKVEATLAVCKTSKDVEERFPDFVKYLPQTAQEALLPSTTDLMDTLKAAGWKKAK